MIIKRNEDLRKAGYEGVENINSRLENSAIDKGAVKKWRKRILGYVRPLRKMQEREERLSNL